MNIVITCGHPHSGFQSVHTLLIEAGLTQASISKREGMSATEFHQRVLSTHGVDLAMPESFAPVTPSRVWDNLAVDLFLGNLEAPDWGWADPGAVWLLDFWSQFDPQIRFVLVYASPDFVVGEMLRQGALSPDGVPKAMESWVAYHTELLRFFHRHRDRCILVDCTAATSMPQRLVTKTVDGLGLDLNPSSVPQSGETPPQSVLEALMVRGLVPRDTEASAIHAELEGTADLSKDSDTLPPDLVQAWGEYRHILVHLDQGTKEAQRLRETTARFEQEVEDLRRGLGRAADEMALQQVAFAEQRERLDLTLSAQQATQKELASAIDGLRACERDKDSCTKQLTAKQVEFDKQSTARKEAEQRLGEVSRRADEATEALKAAVAAQTVTEVKLAESESKATAVMAENESLLLKLHQTQEDLKQYHLRCQTLEEAEKQRQTLEKALATERAKQSGLVDEIKQLQARVAQGEVVAKQRATAQKESESKAAVAMAENELLLLQLHQTQEELEQYYLRCQTLEEAEKQRQTLETALATERARQSGLADEIKQLQARVAQGEVVAKQLATAQREVEGQVAARKQADAALADARAKQAELAGEITQLQARLAQSEAVAKQLAAAQKDLEGQVAARKQADAALADARAKQAELAGEIKQLQARLAQSEAVAKQLAAAQKDLEGQVAARKQAEQSLAEAVQRTENLSRQLIAEKSAHKATEEALKQDAARVVALAQENELLLLQLHQVQEELERYYLQCQKPSWSEVPTSFGSGVTLKQFTQATIDLRGEINGDNWYDAEGDGRWAGPGQISGLMLPALPAGEYQLALEVVDAIQPDVLNGMVLSLNGKPLAIKRRHRGSLTLVTAKFSSDTSTPGEEWKLELGFPRLLSPAERGSDDHRTLAVRVRMLSIVPISTESDWSVADASGSNRWGGTQPAQISFDLRGEIDGDNWYDAEQDGRWAGPGHVSSLMLPALGAGRYQMELDVVDAIAPEIVNGMTLSLNGKPVVVNPKCHGYPTLVTAEFSTDMPARDGQWELQISFPRVESPADHGSADHRTLAIRLHSVSVKVVGPEDLSAATLHSRNRISAARGTRKSYRWWGRKK